VLDWMDKGTRVTRLIDARKRLGAHDIRVGLFIQLGYLGEQLSDLIATRELITLARPDDIGISVSYPLPGTRFFEQVKSQIGDKTHWRDCGDLAMMFRGTYDSTFYRCIRDLLHDQVALQQSSGTESPESDGPAFAALAARWEALIASESLHRNADATPVPVPPHDHAVPLRRVAAAQHH
jgi:anaerobic magnesium-protoporphyrin IX monomethyl ester cyclase